MKNFIRTIGKVLIPFFRITVTYEEKIPKEGALLVCGKHLSLLDGPVVYVIFPRQINFMSKVEIFRSRFMKIFLKNVGSFSVTRGTGDLAALKMAMTILKNGEVMGLFPEGERRPFAEKLEGKPGAVTIAYKAKAKIVPFGFYMKDYTFKPFRKTYVRFGAPVSPQDLGVKEGTKEEFILATEKLMEIIHDLSEENYEAKTR